MRFWFGGVLFVLILTLGAAYNFGAATPGAYRTQLDTRTLKTGERIFAGLEQLGGLVPEPVRVVQGLGVARTSFETGAGVYQPPAPFPKVDDFLTGASTAEREENARSWAQLLQQIDLLACGFDPDTQAYTRYKAQPPQHGGDQAPLAGNAPARSSFGGFANFGAENDAAETMVRPLPKFPDLRPEHQAIFERARAECLQVIELNDSLRRILANFALFVGLNFAVSVTLVGAAPERRNRNLLNLYFAGAVFLTAALLGDSDRLSGTNAAQSVDPMDLLTWLSPLIFALFSHRALSLAIPPTQPETAAPAPIAPVQAPPAADKVAPSSSDDTLKADLAAQAKELSDMQRQLSELQRKKRLEQTLRRKRRR